jgi:hypothetical protein
MGAILFELLTGVPYLQGVTEARLQERVRHHAAPEFPPGLRLPGEQWVGLLSGVLAPSPQDRPANVASLASAITKIREVAGLPRWSKEILGTLTQRLESTDTRSDLQRGPAALLGLRAPSRPEPTAASVRGAEPSVTRENLFDDLGPARKAPPPPPPPLSDPPPMQMPAMEMPAFRRPLSRALAESMHSTDEMIQADRTELGAQDRTRFIYGAALFLFGTALVLTVLTLVLFLTS